MSLHFLNRTSVLLIGLLISLVSTTTMAQETIRLNFGVYSSNKPSTMVRVYRPILKELEKNMTRRLGRTVDIRMQIARDYDQGLAHLTSGRVDFSAFGPASYVEAKRTDAGLSILAVESKNKTKFFHGIIAVAEDSPITDISELRGKAFAFGDEGSTIGRYLSQLTLVQAGIHAKDLGHYEYLGRHDTVGTAVGAGSFDAGALNEKTFKKLVAADVPIRELMRFPNAAKPWIARSGLDETIARALRESLLEVNDPKTLAGLKTDGFLTGSDDDYRIIRTAMQQNGIFFSDTGIIQADSSAAEPALQAAVADSKTLKDLSDAITVTQSLSSEDASTLTVNISLPVSLVEASRGGRALTIHLDIPEEGIKAQSLSTGQ